MRNYNRNTGELKQAVCNCCGKQMLVEAGILKEGICSVEVEWGYFSHKDTMVHRFDLCEECYDQITGKFRIPVEEEEETEV